MTKNLNTVFNKSNVVAAQGQVTVMVRKNNIVVVMGIAMLVLSASIVLVDCGGDSHSNCIDITLAPTNPSIANGNTLQFVANVNDFDDPSYWTAHVTWSSSNTGVATISNAAGSNGLVTSRATGTTTIAATFGCAGTSTILTVQ